MPQRIVTDVATKRCAKLPLPDGFGRKAAVCGVEGSVTDCFEYAPSPSPSTWRFCGPNDRYMDFSTGSLTSRSHLEFRKGAGELRLHRLLCLHTGERRVDRVADKAL